MTTGLVWFRSDLRLADNPAWGDATAGNDRVVALFVIDPLLWDAVGALRRSLLASHLASLDSSLAERGGRLLVRRGTPVDVLVREARRVEAVYWNDDVAPYSRRRDRAVLDALGPKVRVHHGRYVHAPGRILGGTGEPYRVFTPFHRRWAAVPWEPWPEPGEADLGDDPGEGVPGEPPPPMAGGEAAAWERLARAVERADAYGEVRDRPDLDATSRLSVDLKFGTLSPRTVVRALGEAGEGHRSMVRQLAWRDFYADVMHHHPYTVLRAMRPEYEGVRWREDPEGLEAWQRGLTGYPIVDAGMRQLAAEGWIHNRVRMIAASFLVKDLLIDWRVGERHFRRYLLDSDVAQNVGNWQWVAGTGTDAAPYFRVFNPVRQSRRFDPHGDYIRAWIPELRRLEGGAIHAPWEAGPLELEAAGVALGDTYPSPIVDHLEAREAAIAAYEAARA
jgi:deoxyribodipyrimidine photo-lyase